MISQSRQKIFKCFSRYFSDNLYKYDHSGKGFGSKLRPLQQIEYETSKTI